MTLPAALDALARELDAVRAEVHREADGLSQAQADWRPTADDWSVGEILHHLTLAEINTGKLTSKLLKETGSAVAPYPPDLAGFAPLPPWPPGPREAPPVVRPEKGHPIGQLLHDMRAAREQEPSVARAAGDRRPSHVHVAPLHARRDGPRPVVDAPGPSRSGPSPADPADQEDAGLSAGVTSPPAS